MSESTFESSKTRKLTQDRLEKMMREEGTARYWKRVTERTEKGHGSETSHAKRIMESTLPGLLESLKGWIEKASGGGAGRRHAALEHLQAIDNSVACLISLRTVLDALTGEPSMSRLVSAIGRNLEMEARLQWYKDSDSDHFEYISMRADAMRMVDRAVRVRFFHGEFRAHFEETGMVDFAAWSKSQAATVGAVMLHLIEGQGLVQSVTEVANTKPLRMKVMVKPSDALGQWIADYHKFAEVLHPVYLPTVDAPQPWSQETAKCPSGAGEVYSMNIIKTRSEALVNDVASRDMPEVYEALNAIQATPWVVESRVYDVACKVWEDDMAIAGIVSRQDRPLPPKPEDIDSNTEALKRWKKEAGAIYTFNNKNMGRGLSTAKILNVARIFMDVPAIYFPHQLDFRGRLYPVPAGLSPQGCDLSRGLLVFSEGKPITHKHAADWLAIHGANCYGVDKVTMEERIEWTETNRDNILASAQDPLGFQWWTCADKPWQFLCFCFEWAGWLQQGPGFVSRIAVSVDGSNNGLQILSLLCRDEDSGRATNVSPSASPQDIYGDVAELAKLLLEADRDNEEEGWMADYWLRFGINRKTTKRPVMVLPYGGTFNSCMEYTELWFQESLEARGETLAFDGDKKLRRKAVVYLAKKVWAAIHELVGRPRKVMEWLQNACRAVTAKNESIEWVTPVGLLVRQRYLSIEKFTVESLVGDKIRRISLVQDGKVLDPRRQVNGISPNFVHSLDAAALCRTVCYAKKCGLTHFAMVHDSYGTHAADMDVLAGTLRHVFSSMFSEDLLATLKAQLEARFEVSLEPLPEYGRLDPRDVVASEFFFA